MVCVPVMTYFCWSISYSLLHFQFKAEKIKKRRYQTLYTYFEEM